MDGRLTTHPDAIDPGVVLHVYAAIAALTGVALIAWGPLWFAGSPDEPLYQQYALVRTLGAMIIAMSCLVAGLASTDDPAGQRRGLVWLAAAHLVVGVVVAVQRFTIWQTGPISALVIGVLAAIVASLFYIVVTMDGEGGRFALGHIPLSLTSVFGSRTAQSTDALRSRYEQQIREAAKQEERNHLARDLHDSVKQQIFAIHTSAAAAQAHLSVDAPETRAALEQVRDSAREAMAEMEAMLDQLRATPLDGAGLVGVIARQCEALRFRTGADVRFTHGELPPSEALAPGAHQVLCRVAQEALANVARHARATDVKVTLNVDADGFTLEVQDNGAGFDASTAESGMGVANMRARTDEAGGTLVIAPRSGAGTSVRCSLPCARLETRDEVRRHMRNQGLAWGVAFAFNMFFNWTSPATITVGAVTGIGLARSIVGYRAVSRRPVTR
jgi:signal transduction histidine kinase